MTRTAHAYAFLSLVLLALCHLVEGRRLVDEDATDTETAPD